MYRQCWRVSVSVVCFSATLLINYLHQLTSVREPRQLVELETFLYAIRFYCIVPLGLTEVQFHE